MSFLQRSHGCGEIRAEHAGQSIVLNGWAHRVRDLGGVTFVDMRETAPAYGVRLTTLDEFIPRMLRRSASARGESEKNCIPPREPEL